MSPSGGPARAAARRARSRSTSISSTSSASSSSSSLSHAERIQDLDADDDDLQGQGVAVQSDPQTMDLATPALKIGFRGWFIRALALLCACALSIGSHYGSYFLGPIKSRLSREMGTSNAQFSLLIASFSLNNTWTPLLGGVLTARLGTAWSSIIATSLIFAGQSILLLGDFINSVRLMSFGLFIFGLGISPLAVVQETIIVRFFSSHGLGISLALGLLAGKGASFISAVTSYPLSETFGPRAPFIVATVLAGASWVVNLVYLSSSAWFARSTGVCLEDSEVRAEARRVVGLTAAERMTEAEALRKITRKRKVKFFNITKLGDIFWAYVGVNILCGAIWSPFLHLAANVIERRYGLSEKDAGDKASLLLAGAIFLYPVCGYLTDRLKTAAVVHKMFMLSSFLTLLCYFWLALPPSFTLSPTPALVAFGGGHGFATLLLVIIVPHLVPIRYVSTALGAHKSLEQTGATISQTLSGLLLDIKRSQPDPAETPDNLHSISVLLRVFLVINAVQLAGTIGLWRMQVRIDRQVERQPAAHKGYMAISGVEVDDSRLEDATMKNVPEYAVDDGPGLSTARVPRQHPAVQRSMSARSDRPLLSGSRGVWAGSSGGHVSRRPSHQGIARSRRELRRGKAFAVLCALSILAAWGLFMGVAYSKLRARA